jgi:hypothetical protein
MATILNEYGTPYSNPQRYAHASEYDRRRGVTYPVKTEDIDKLITPWDSRRLRSLSSRLYTNVGVIKGAVDQKADYSVGEAFLPAYVGESDFADGKQIASFMRKVWYPNCNVKGQPFDWHKTLELASVAIDRDGDQFWLKIVGEDGFPRLQVVPAHRVGDGPDGSGRVSSGKFKDFKISDGVIVYKSGKPAAYRVLTGDLRISETFEDIEAANVIHIFNPDFAEQTRGIPAFSHALMDISACLASTEDERIRQQIISRLHLTVFNESGGPDLDDPMNSIQNPTTDSSFVMQNIPGGVVYMQAGSGEKMEQVKHDSPGDMWENFQDRMIRMSLAPCWPYSIWKGAGQGTDARAEIVKGRRFVLKRQRDLRRAALSAFSFAYSVFQKAGRVPLLDNPFAWSFSKPPRLSVDDGRESKMEVDEWRAGLRNTDEITEARGLTEEEFYTKRAHSVALRKVIARQVSQDVSASSGFEIEVEDREMAMLTANEMGNDTQDTSDQIIQPNQNNEDSQN